MSTTRAQRRKVRMKSQVCQNGNENGNKLIGMEWNGNVANYFRTPLLCIPRAGAK